MIPGSIQGHTFPRVFNKVPGWLWGHPTCKVGNWADCLEAPEKWEEKRQVVEVELV